MSGPVVTLGVTRSEAVMGLFMDFKAPVAAQRLSVTIAEEAQQRTDQEIDAGADGQGGWIGQHGAADGGHALRRQNAGGAADDGEPAEDGDENAPRAGTGVG